MVPAPPASSLGSSCTLAPCRIGGRITDSAGAGRSAPECGAVWAEVEVAAMGGWRSIDSAGAGRSAAECGAVWAEVE
eukprot:1471745-Prymnesium_polylepis.1